MTRALPVHPSLDVLAQSIFNISRESLEDDSAQGISHSLARLLLDNGVVVPTPVKDKFEFRKNFWTMGIYGAPLILVHANLVANFLYRTFL